MKKLYLIALPLCLFLFPATILACSCVHRPPANAFNEAKVVFIGRMLGGTQKLSVTDENGKAISIEAGKVRFAVEEMFKGNNAEELTLEVDSNEGTSCGPYGLTRGAKYVVYAYTSRDGKVIYTGVCTRTTTVDSEYAKEDLEFLRNLPPAGSGGSLHGRIWADLRAGGAIAVPNVRVKIINADDQVIAAFTDEQGEFKVKQLKPGKYRVEPEFPANYTSEHKSEEVTVDDRGTAQVGFELYIDGKVAGRIIDSEGNTFNSIFLNMVGGDKRVFGHSTGEGGGFEVEGTPPGEYVLFLELQADTYAKNKPYYYPGTFDREKATKIRVGLGERVEGLEFRLPARYLVRTVEGEAVLKNGTPAANVTVFLLCPRSTAPNGVVVEFGPSQATTDEKGHFRLEAITGETYWLEARGEEVHSASRKLSVTDNVKNLKVRVSEEGAFGAGCP